MPLTFKSTKDIRGKYVLSHLAFDWGQLEELTAETNRKEMHL